MRDHEREWWETPRTGDVCAILRAGSRYAWEPDTALLAVVESSSVNDPLGLVHRCRDVNGHAWTVTASRLRVVARPLPLAPVESPLSSLQAPPLHGDYPSARPGAPGATPVTPPEAPAPTSAVTPTPTDLAANPPPRRWSLQGPLTPFQGILAAADAGTMTHLEAFARAMGLSARSSPPPPPPPFSAQEWNYLLHDCVRGVTTREELAQHARDGRAPVWRESVWWRGLAGEGHGWFYSLPAQVRVEIVRLDSELRTYIDYRASVRNPSFEDWVGDTSDRLGRGCGGQPSLPHSVRRATGTCVRCGATPTCCWCGGRHNLRRLKDVDPRPYAGRVATVGPGSVECADPNECPGIPF